MLALLSQSAHKLVCILDDWVEGVSFVATIALHGGGCSHGASHGGCSCLRLMPTQAVQAGAVRRPVHLPVAVEADAAIPGGCRGEVGKLVVGRQQLQCCMTQGR